MKVFISYAREDESVAQRLYSSLAAIPGVIPWLDRRNLLPGDDWRHCIEVAMRDSRLIVVLLSTNSVNKDGFVQKEVRVALDLFEEKPPGLCFLIPARVEFCVPRFQQFRKLQWVDLFDDWADSIGKIRKVIEREQTQDRQFELAADAVQQEKNRADARSLIQGLPTDLRENLGHYVEWLWLHEYGMHPYEKARSAIPNWTKQAQPEWRQYLYAKGVLDSVEPETGQFTDIGLEVLHLLD